MIAFWEVVLQLMGWFFIIVAAIGALIIGFAVLVGLWRGLMSIMKSFRKKDNLEQFTLDSMSAAGDYAKGETLFRGMNEQAFLEGSYWAWDRLHQ